MIADLAALRENVLLAPLTTLAIGGPARYFVEAETEEVVTAALSFAKHRELALFVLGGGSNVLISDEGFGGLVLHIALRGVSYKDDGTFVEVTARAGEDWDPLVGDCVARNLAGLECLSGIPGSVGGTPVQNVGAYGQDVSETIVKVRAYDRVEERTVEMGSADCGFGYRTSIFNTTARDRYIVLGVVFRLRRGGSPALRYADLLDYFSDSTSLPSLDQVRSGVIAIRARKGMVLTPHDPDSRSAGSFFKNPILSAIEIGRVKETVGEVPSNPLPDGRFKVPAAWLIERAGFERGTTRGPVSLSAKHSLSIVNRGQATAREVIAFAGEIRAHVHQSFGIELQMEPVMIGFPG